MTAASDKEWADYIGGKSAAGSRKILLQVPDALLTALKLSTTNEDISLPARTVNGAFCFPLKAETLFSMNWMPKNQ